MAAYASLVSVMQLINLLQHHRRPPISLHENQLRLLTEKLTFLQTFLESYNPHLACTTEADPLESRITVAAYAAEDTIESHIMDRMERHGKRISSSALYEAVEKVIDELTLIQKEAMGTKQHELHTPPHSLRSSSNTKESISVGIDDVKQKLMDYLTTDVKDLQIIPVVGMAGSGKTTLAQTVYENPSIKKHFYVCAWATISQEYTISKIIKQVLEMSEKVGEHLSDGELGDMLHKHLYNRRYLIVLDDMWSVEAYEQVTKYLPDKKNGSRIVVTTRLLNVASTLSNSYSLEMKLLDEVDSWKLLSQIVFGKKDIPHALEKIGKKIGKSCRGLPMSIVVVGGFLAKSERTIQFWKHIEENLNSVVNLEDDERCLKTLHLSYKQLPVYLRPCFLYMGVFREDEVIRVSRIVKLWVTEGFLKPVSGKSLEEIAKENLKDLVDRNLVTVHEVGSTGNMKYCGIHDLLRDFCSREAQRERFYGFVSATLERIVDGQRRIVISSNMSGDDAKNALSSLSLTRSLVWDFQTWFSYKLHNCRFLRIMHHRIPSGAARFLCNSRFLVISNTSGGCIFPHPIWRFWNLQVVTFSAGMFKFEVVARTEFWCMSHIRHVWIEGLCLPDPPNGHDDVVLNNLRTLGSIWNFKCSEQVVKRIPNIIKLEISYEELPDKYCLNNLDCLDKLESLTCSIYQVYTPSGLVSLHSLIDFPHSLKKLTLLIEKFQYWDEILDKIGVLPFLQKLKLKRGCFREKQWVTTKGHFRKLKFLLLDYCYDLQVWTAESSHFPCLERLFLHGITELVEIPLEFAEISSLRVIKLNHCSDSAIESAKEISEEHEML